MVKIYQFRGKAKKRAEFTAVQWDGSDELYTFLRGWTVNQVQHDTDGNLLVQEQDSVAIARPGDYIRRIELSSGTYAFRKVAHVTFEKLYKQLKAKEQ